MEHVSDRIVQMIATKYKNSHPAIGHESRLSSDLAMDSLDKVDLMMALESEFGISISDDDLENLKTVGQTVELVKKKISAPNP
ncbi:MAG: acyl carrier protein [Bacteroidetes bacterium]|jgi:acyl carrier protein|nr:acyl carrier protein [Bacteroidota bacterium]